MERLHRFLSKAKPVGPWGKSPCQISVFVLSDGAPWCALAQREFLGQEGPGPGSLGPVTVVVQKGKSPALTALIASLSQAACQTFPLKLQPVWVLFRQQRNIIESTGCRVVISDLFFLQEIV